MELTNIHHSVFFTSPCPDVFELLVDGSKFAAFSGGPATIERRSGGKFSLFGGKVSGVAVEIKPDSLLVQDWRGEDWPAGHKSRATFELTPIHEGRGCALKFHQTGVPAEKADQIDNGWQSYYWSPMAEYLRNVRVAVVRRFLEEFKNHANLDIVDETWTADCVLHVPGMLVPPGRAGQKTVGKAIFDAFSNVHVEVNDTIVEGDRVVERHTARAVHKGEFMGIPASGKEVHWTENHIYRIRDGKIAETWSEVSFHDLMAQISGAKTSAALKG
jgi:predicted ester cyclase